MVGASTHPSCQARYVLKPPLLLLPLLLLCCAVRRALEFLITTGPGPVPRLDGLNPVFGRVESGMDVVAKLAQVRRACRAWICVGVVADRVKAV